MIWQASAPSNIALIKYMGKSDAKTNVASNPSISYTLEGLRTIVELELSQNGKDAWQPLFAESILPIDLSPKGQQRFLDHVERLKKAFDFNGNFIVRSGNTFPSDCGMASSASSYAALTMAMMTALSELQQKPLPDLQTQAHWSRKASGSSGRSFFGPWCLWDGDRLETMQLPYQNLLHSVIVVDREKKTPSSSEAHIRVAQSLLFENRPLRASQRLDILLKAMHAQKWQDIVEICWQEFWDMHALFETASPPFGYMTADSLKVLNRLREYWRDKQQGPIVTMDAGPNIHLLFPPEFKAQAHEIQKEFAREFLVLGPPS